MTLGALALIAVFATYWRVPGTRRDDVLIAAGVLGLGWYSPVAALTLAALIVAVWLGLQEPKRATGLFAVAAVATSFIVYKMFAAQGPFERPIGILGFAYAVPRAIHVLLDARYRGAPRPTLRLLVTYFWFFPTLAIGPIHRIDEFERELRRRRFDSHQIGLGFERILVGLVSVKVLGDWAVSGRLDTIVRRFEEDRAGLAALGKSVVYGLNLYFQFAGWTAVAIGVAAAFGIRVAENFHRPFAQRNLAAFWRSWHITLTRWTNAYVFQPVAAQTRRPFVAITATMFAIALWHEFSGRYVAWAFWHATGLLVHRLFQRFMSTRSRPPFISERVAHVASIALTMAFVFIGFTWTRAGSFTDGLRQFEILFTGKYL